MSEMRLDHVRAAGGAMKPGALVLAGGAGERMRDSGGACQPLVQVRGVSLLERNVWRLIGAGLREIWVACAAHHHAIRREVERLARAARPRGIAIEVLVEDTPLGTIGAAGLLRGRVAQVLAVNADNVTALDLGALLASHVQSAADLTLASHVHVERLPYGELCVDGDRVLAIARSPRARSGCRARWACWARPRSRWSRARSASTS
jgi:NDP-mannose synthase